MIHTPFPTLPRGSLELDCHHTPTDTVSQLGRRQPLGAHHLCHPRQQPRLPGIPHHLRVCATVRARGLAGGRPHGPGAASAAPCSARRPRHPAAAPAPLPVASADPAAPAAPAAPATCAARRQGLARARLPAAAARAAAAAARAAASATRRAPRGVPEDRCRRRPIAQAQARRGHSHLRRRGRLSARSFCNKSSVQCISSRVPRDRRVGGNLRLHHAAGAEDIVHCCRQ